MAGEFGISMLTERLMPQSRPSAVKSPLEGIEGAAGAGGPKGPSFQDTLQHALGDVNDALTKADVASQKFATGQATNLHDVMIAMEKAEVSLKTLTAIRSKVVDAYQEIMRMQV